MQRGLITGIIVGLAVAIFTLQNLVKVQVNLLWWKFEEVPLALLIVVTLVIGVTITSIFSFIEKQKLRNRIRKLNHRISELENKMIDETNKDENIALNEDDDTHIEGEPGNRFFDD